MKRAKDRWLRDHLAVGLLFLSCLALPQATGLKATSLFRTTTTSTTTTTNIPDPQEVDENADPEAAPTSPPSNYTGIPQIDYIHDPNLPRELNGYNLSSYPFFATVPPPEEMTFKCDGLHDGFYAAVAQKCQVYHQCLYGTRYDFLCANYTAFDQKTFICHFVSEVDCINSHKYFHRNDALYQATTTSTAAPPPTTTTTTTTTLPPPRQRGPARRRPSRRRRPHYDYYEEDETYPSAREEDYYEEDRRPYNGGSRRRKRPRPAARRPAYDEYDDDERFDRRPPERSRGEDDDYEDRRSYDRPRKNGKRPSDTRDRNENRKPYDDEDSRSFERPRKPSRPDDRPAENDRKNFDRPRRPLRDDDDLRDERPLKENSEREDTGIDDKNLRDNRPYRDERPLRDRPFRDERPYRDEKPYRNDRNRNEDRNHRDDGETIEESRAYGEKKSDDNVEPTVVSGLVKPSGGSLFSKPRIPPKIARPVPVSEKDKFKYVPTQTTQAPAPIEEEYYDDYEIEDTKPVSPPKASSYSPRNRQEPERDRFKANSDRTRSNFDQDAPKRPLFGASGNKRKQEVQENKRQNDKTEEIYEDIEEPRPKRPIINNGRGETRHSSRKVPPKYDDEYYYDEEDTRPKLNKDKQIRSRNQEKYNRNNEDSQELRSRNQEKYNRNNEDSQELPKQKPISKNKDTTTTEPSVTEKGRNQGFVRVVKRPFLPSRGGSPYLPRGLQPLGGKNLVKNSSTTTTTTQATTTRALTTTKTTQNPVSSDYSYEADYEIKDEKASSQQKDTVENYSDEVIQSEEKYSLNSNTKESEYSNEDKYYDEPINTRQNKPQTNDNKNSDKTNSKTQNQSEENKSKENYSSTENYDSSSVENFNRKPQYETPQKQQEYKNPTAYNNKVAPEKIKEKESIFIPSPQISDPYKPTNKPYSQRIPENISIKQNLADPIESDYDVTINEALNPTLPNLTPIRNFPSPFIMPTDRDYSFTRFRNAPQDSPSPQFNNYQYRNQPSNNLKYPSPQRVSGGYIKNFQNSDSSIAASEPVVREVSVRTPQSFYIQHPRFSSSYSADETNSGLRHSHVTYRHTNLGDYFI